jgi:hypothetical protein
VLFGEAMSDVLVLVTLRSGSAGAVANHGQTVTSHDAGDLQVRLVDTVEYAGSPQPSSKAPEDCVSR